ncbi:SARP family transcriptional regulator [Sinosporangium siamense]|uniref:SARP family transcriptional regulator n=1 Tax=Sinosporangium siamense TaxID=1367973 RepID=A0A919V9J0_9ACTN|nr:SARP family transcriptional regulator [Sinosporangium siamense]
MPVFKLASGSGVVLCVEGEEHSLGFPRQQLILAMLLLSPAQAITVSEIADRIWGEHPPPQARKDIASYVSRLRGRLRNLLADDVKIVSRRTTYALVVEPENIDLWQVRARSREARALLKSGEMRHALRLLQEAEELWPGEALIGLPGAWAARMADTLALERRKLRCERIDLELRLGHHEQVLGELYGLAAADPTDETVARQLMTALYRSSRQAESLRVYQRVGHHLRESLGTGPGPELKELHLRILRADPELAVTPIYSRGGAQRQPNTLPRDIPHFTGRRREIAVVNRWRAELGHGFALVLQGMPGVGKTALAVHLAHSLAADYPDACLYLDMRGHDATFPPLSSAEALAAVLEMLGIQGRRVPSSLEDRAAVWHAQLAHRRTVVILDDVSGPEQVRPLLTGAPSALMLITTRSRFEESEAVQPLSLDVLSPGEAADLVRQLVDGPAGTTPTHVEEVVEACGGLPLALTLHAGRRWELSEEKSGRLRRLRGPIPGTADVPQEVGSAFALSYRDLPGEAQLVFRRLGLSPCRDITLWTAAVLSGLPVVLVRESVDLLVRHHLLREMRPGHVQFHDLIRGFAREQAQREDSEGDRRRALERLLDHYHRTVVSAVLLAETGRADTHADAQAEFADAESAQQWLRSEWSNVLLLAEYAADHEWKRHCARLTHALWEFLDAECRWSEALAACELAVRACQDPGDSAWVAQALLDLGFFQYRTAAYAEALHHTTKALKAHRRRGDRQGEARSLHQIGFIHFAWHHLRDALAHYEESIVVYRSVGDIKGEARVLGPCGIALFCLGRPEQAFTFLERALEAYRIVGDRRGEGDALNNLAEFQRRRGFHRDAVKLYEESMEIFKGLSGRQSLAIVNKNRGDVHHYRGEFAQALECYAVARVTFEEIGDLKNQVEIFNSLGKLYLETAAANEARVFFQKARDMADKFEWADEKALSLIGMAGVHKTQRRYAEALDLCLEAIALTRGFADIYHEALAHKLMGDIYLCLRSQIAARISWRQALRIFEQLSLPDAEEIEIKISVLAE